MRSIKREVVLSTIKVAEFVDGQQRDVDNLLVDGNVNQKAAMKTIRKKYPDRNVFVVDISTSSQTRVLSGEDFLKYSTVEPKPFE